MRSPFDFEDEFGDERQQWDEWKDWGRKLGQLGSWTGWIIIVVIIGIWLASGFTQIGPSEVGLVKRFGAHVGTMDPGIHWHLPWPVESVTTVDVLTRRTEEIGFRTITPPPNPRYESIPDEALMLTGDGNIVWIDSVVQYEVADPVKFAFNVRNPSTVVSNAAEAILREQAAQRDLDPILTTARDVIARDVEQQLVQLMNTYDTGIRIVTVKLQDVKPPEEVRAAFDDVNSARQDKETLTNEAQAYRNDVVPRARGDAAQIVQKAEAYRAQTVNGAQGDVARFKNVVQEYQIGDQSVTIERLYIETMEQIVPNLKPLIVTEAITTSGGTLNLMDLSRFISEQDGSSGGGNSQ